MSRRRLPLWTLLGVVLAVALLVGSGALSSAPPTAAQRATAIEQDVRCPSCEDLSVATSSAPTAAAVRATITRMVGRGQTDQQIEAYLTTRYGAAIVLDPPTSGWSVLVWVLPALVGALAVAALLVVLVRRRRSSADPDADLARAAPDSAAVEERRRFLTRSLTDTDAEYMAGDLSDRDYLMLRQRDLARLAKLGPGGSMAGVSVPPAADAPAHAATSVATLDPPAPDVEERTALVTGSQTVRRGRSRWFLIGAVVCFGAALAVAVPLFTSTRLPGQTATGSLSLSASQQVTRSLDQAADIENEGKLDQAAQLYQSILSAHPDNEPALAQLGWLEFQIGQAGDSTSLLADARAKLDRAATLAPDDYAVHLYLGTVLLQQDDNAAGAVGQYRLFLEDAPPSTVLDQAAATIRNAFGQAGQPVPSGVPAA